MLLRVSGELGVVKFDPTEDFRVNDKGEAWAKIRCVAKDRVRDTSGQWQDGPPCFIDVYVNGKPAEHITESVRVGDQIIVSGRLAQREWEQDGQKRQSYHIKADDIGVSVRFTTALTDRAKAEGVDVVKATFEGAQEEFESPF